VSFVLQRACVRLSRERYLDGDSDDELDSRTRAVRPTATAKHAPAQRRWPEQQGTP